MKLLEEIENAGTYALRRIFDGAFWAIGFWLATRLIWEVW